jgi:hypothetical protein
MPHEEAYGRESFLHCGDLAGASTSIFTNELTSNYFGATISLVVAKCYGCFRSLGPVSFSSMSAPIFLLAFAFVAFVCKQPEDKSSCTDANSEGQYNHDC